MYIHTRVCSINSPKSSTKAKANTLVCVYHEAHKQKLPAVLTLADDAALAGARPVPYASLAAFANASAVAAPLPPPLE